MTLRTKIFEDKLDKVAMQLQHCKFNQLNLAPDSSVLKRLYHEASLLAMREVEEFTHWKYTEWTYRLNKPKPTEELYTIWKRETK